METIIFPGHFIHHLLFRCHLDRHRRLSTYYGSYLKLISSVIVPPAVSTVLPNPTAPDFPWSGFSGRILLDDDRLFPQKRDFYRDVSDLPLYHLWSLDEREGGIDGVSSHGA
jgi:hypothetical protein